MDIRVKINTIKLNINFEDTNMLRDFQKHLKGMDPENYNFKISLKKEFEDLLPWIVQNLSR